MEPTGRTPQLSPVLIGLFKGVLYQEQSPDLWQALLQLQARVRDHAGVFGLELVLDEAEGYAYLRQRPGGEGEPDLPRLVQRRQLGYAVSLLLALLRKKLAEHDAAGGDTRLILSRTQIVDLVQLFLPAGTNEARLVDRIDTDINKVVEFGFLRRLRGQDVASSRPSWTRNGSRSWSRGWRTTAPSGPEGSPRPHDQHAPRAAARLCAERGARRLPPAPLRGLQLGDLPRARVDPRAGRREQLAHG